MPQKYNHDLVTLRPQTSNTCKKSTNEHKVIRKMLQIFKKYTLLFQPFCYWILQCNKLLLTIYCRTLDVKSSPALNFSGIFHMRHQNLSYLLRRLRLKLRLRIRLLTISADIHQKHWLSPNQSSNFGRLHRVRDQFVIYCQNNYLLHSKTMIYNVKDRNSIDSHYKISTA